MSHWSPIALKPFNLQQESSILLTLPSPHSQSLDWGNNAIAIFGHNVVGEHLIDFELHLRSLGEAPFDSRPGFSVGLSWCVPYRLLKPTRLLLLPVSEDSCFPVHGGELGGDLDWGTGEELYDSFRRSGVRVWDVCHCSIWYNAVHFHGWQRNLRL